MYRLLVISLIFIFVLKMVAFVVPVYSYTTQQAAAIVIGQTNFTNIGTNQGGSPGANTLASMYGIATDGTKLAISDYDNNRVLIYNTIPTSNNASADVVLGQANFTSADANRGGSVAANTLRGPNSLTFANGKLLIADTGNCRVLIWNSIPTSNGVAADVVIGQPNMTNDGCSASQTELNAPNGVDYDLITGKLLIGDSGNNRVLIFNSVPTTNGAAANVVVGQTNFTSATSGTTATTMNSPYEGKIIENKLVVTDTTNSRVLIYNSVPTSNGASADVVIGQANLTAGDSNRGGSVAANTLSYPPHAVYDGQNLIIADGQNNRILLFNSIPTSNNASADDVIGQANLTSSNTGATSTTFNDASGGLASTAECGKLIVGDVNNHRVLIYNNDVPCLTPTPTPTATPTPTQSTTQTSTTSSSSSSSNNTPQISQSSLGENSGGAYKPTGDSSTHNQTVSAIIEPNTFNFSAYVSAQSTAVSATNVGGLLPNPFTGVMPTAGKTKTNAVLAGGSMLGVKTGGNVSWQVGNLQQIWYKAYAPTGSDKSPAKIIPELQKKVSIVALSYTDADLVPPGRPKSKFNNKTLKLAHSIDGITWKILPTSVVDTKNKTVAALHKVGGYYMIVGR